MSDEDVGPNVDSLAKIANLLAIVAVKGKTQGDAIHDLVRAGFNRAEIARLLGTTPANVSQTLYEYKIGRRVRRDGSNKKD